MMYVLSLYIGGGRGTIYILHKVRDRMVPCRAPDCRLNMLLFSPFHSINVFLFCIKLHSIFVRFGLRFKLTIL